MTAATHIALSSSSRIMTGGLLMAGALDAVAHGVAAHRSVVAKGRLADRLSAARGEAHEALTLARDLAAELARTRRELVAAQAALAEEKAYSASVTAALRQVAATR